MMSRPRECVLLAGVVLVYSRCIEGVLRAYYCARFGCRGPCDALLTTAWQELSRFPLFFWTAWSTSWCCGVDLLRFLLVVVILVILVVLSLGSFRSTSNGFSLIFCSLCGMCRKPVSLGTSNLEIGYRVCGCSAEPGWCPAQGIQGPGGAAGLWDGPRRICRGLVRASPGRVKARMGKGRSNPNRAGGWSKPDRGGGGWSKPDRGRWQVTAETGWHCGCNHTGRNRELPQLERWL